MLRIAYLTGAAWRGVTMAPGALPAIEQDTFALISAAGLAHDIAFTVAPWTDATLPAQGFDAALIRSCWDYTSQADRFIAQLQAFAEASLPVINPPDIVRWNARKAYLSGLAAAGAPTIETLWADRLEPHLVARAFDTLDTAELVVKPQIGAGGRATLRLKRSAWSEADLIDAPTGPAMLQPFYPSIETEGEASLFFVDGAHTHAVLKRPRAGDWFANAADARFSAFDPTPPMHAAARAALAAAPPGLFYARVDLVLAPGGGWRVIELEAIEPHLFLAYAPSAAEPFVAALARLVRAGASGAVFSE